MDSPEEGAQQMLPVATYMLSFESADDLSDYMAPEADRPTGCIKDVLYCTFTLIHHQRHD